MDIYKYFKNSPLFYVSDDYTTSVLYEGFSIDSKNYLPKVGKYEQEANDSHFATNSIYGPRTSSTMLRDNNSFEKMNLLVEDTKLQNREEIFKANDYVCQKEAESVMRFSSKEKLENLEELVKKNKNSYSINLIGKKEDLLKIEDGDIKKSIFNNLPNSIRYLLILGNNNSDNIGQRHLSKTKDGLEICTFFNKEYVSKYVFAIE